MGPQRDGAGLYSLLTSLHHPAAASLSPEALDWVCEAPGCGDFLDWLLTSVTRDNVLEDAELEAYSAIPEEERLSGQILSEALSTFGDTNTGGQMTDAELEKQVAMLESELSVMEQARDKLEGLVEGMEARMADVTNTAGLEAMLEAEEREERRAQEAIFDLNIKYNKAIENLCSAVTSVVRLYEAAGEDMEAPTFVSSIDLAQIKEADAVLDQELEKLMENYFEKKGGEVEQMEALRGRDSAEYERLMSEMARLRESWVSQELARIRAAAREAGLLAQLASVNKEFSVNRDKVEPVESKEDLEEKIAQALDELANLQCQNILNIDCVNKEARNRVTIGHLEEIRDILLQQVAKREILAVLLDRERREVAEVETSIREVITTFREEAERLNNFRLAMRTLAGKKSESEANLIPSEDVVMVQAHKILYNHGLVGHLPTYNCVFDALDKLQDKKRELKKQVQLKKSSQTEDFHNASVKIANIFETLEISESGGRGVMAPPGVAQGIGQVDRAMREAKQRLKEESDAWDKEVKRRPERDMSANLWAEFLVKPKSVIASIKNLENKANR